MLSKECCNSGEMIFPRKGFVKNYWRLENTKHLQACVALICSICFFVCNKFWFFIPFFMINFLSVICI